MSKILADKLYGIDCTMVAGIMQDVVDMGASPAGAERVYRLINVVNPHITKWVRGSDILAAADISADNADRYQQVLDNADDIMQAILAQPQRPQTKRG